MPTDMKEALQSISTFPDQEYIVSLLSLLAAPVFLADKPAVLLTISNRCRGELRLWQLYRRRMLQAAALEEYVLKRRRSSLVTLLYDKRRVHRAITRAGVQAFLSAYGGYPIANTLPGYLKHLAARFRQEPCPHEVGLFLGYPLPDVKGFIAGQRPRLSGYWQVYHAETAARQTFARYRRAQLEMAQLILVCSGRILKWLEYFPRIT